MATISRAEAIARELRKGIVSHRYPAASRLPPERALAREYRTSQITISKAVSILAAEGLVEKRHGSGNYVKHRSRRAVVAFLMESLGREMNPIWYSIYEAFLRSGEADTLTVRHVLAALEDETIDVSRLADADVIVACLALTAARVRSIKSAGIPTVWMDEYGAPLPGCSVVFDNRQAGYMAGVHLLTQGCRHVLYFTKRMAADAAGRPYAPSQRRQEGLAAAFDEHAGSGSAPQVYAAGAEDDACVVDGLARMLRARRRIDGVLCFCDSLAPMVLKAASKAGRRIPQDLAIVGVDGLPVGAMLIPSLTTLRQPVERIGRSAREMVDAILRRDAPDQSLALAPELVVRESSRR